MAVRFAAAAVVSCLLVGAGGALAQMPIPTAPPTMDGGTLFRNQCATCHSLDPADPPRQGPLLKGVIGRRVGGVPGFHYSAGFAGADWVWTPTLLGRWITDPQAMIPGAVMPYRQPDPTVRRKIITYLEKQH
jgi:cytochrome c